MQIDLYTLYLFSYSKEYLFNKRPDLIKMDSFSESSNCIFIDDFIRREVIANNPIDFFKYLEKRQCFKVQVSKTSDNVVGLEFDCRYSKEVWGRDECKENDRQLFFSKLDETLWAEKYRQVSNIEKYEIRLRLKNNLCKEI